MLNAVIVALLALAQPAASPVHDPTAKAATADAEYGFSEKKPVAVGRKYGMGRGAAIYFHSLTGPDGEPVSFKRRGSCCEFDTPNGLVDNKGLLDVYEVTYPGLDKPLVIYVNTYDYEQPMAPVGFKPRRIE
jgi:hypothetical protein